MMISQVTHVAAKKVRAKLLKGDQSSNTCCKLRNIYKTIEDYASQLDDVMK